MDSTLHDLELLLEEFYSPESDSSKLIGLERHLTTFQDNINEGNYLGILERGQMRTKEFVLRSIVLRPSGFQETQDKLIAWYFGLSDRKLVQMSSNALAVVCLEHKPKPFALLDILHMNLHATVHVLCILSALCEQYGRIAQRGQIEKARIYPAVEALSPLIQGQLLKASRQEFKLICDVSKNWILHFQSKNCKDLLHPLFNAHDLTDVEYKELAELVLFIAGRIPITLFSELVYFVLQHVSDKRGFFLGVIACFQERMEDYCSLEQRPQISELITDYTLSCTAKDISEVVGFWEEFATELASLGDVKENGCFEKVAVYTLANVKRFKRDDSIVLLEACYKILENNLIDYLVGQCGDASAMRCLSLLSSQIVNPSRKLVEFLLSDTVACNSDVIALMGNLAKYCRDDREAGRRFCLRLLESICSDDLSVDAAGTLLNFAGSADRDTLLYSCSLLPRTTLEKQKLLTEFVSKSSEGLAPHAKTQVLNTLFDSLLTVPHAQVLATIAVEHCSVDNVGIDQFQQLAQLVLRSIDVLRDPNRSCVDQEVGLLCSCARVFSCSKKDVSGILLLLFDIPPSRSLDIFIAAENKCHFPETDTLIERIIASGTFSDYESLCVLFSTMARTDYDCLMEVGVDVYIQFLSLCSSRYSLPSGYSEYKAFLAVCSDIVLGSKNDNQRNWGSYLYGHVRAQIVTTLFQASACADSSRKDMSAKLLYDLYSEFPESTLMCLASQPYGTKWIPKTKSLATFTANFKNLFN